MRALLGKRFTGKIFLMTDDKKPDLKIVGTKPKPETELTPKQRAFIEEIVKGKTTYKEAYAKVYDVKLNKNGSIPKWVNVEASKMLANPKISLSIQRAISKREEGVVASSIRTRSYVLERLLAESRGDNEDSTPASRVRSLELLGKTSGMFTDTVEVKEQRDSSTIEAEILRLLENEAVDDHH
tara:strand:- start:28773 stop:29321 length:549 start_codon:yes stop_codon:yes gene_type:complete